MGPTVHTTRTGLLKAEKGSFLLDGWWKFANSGIAIPESLAPMFVTQFHKGNHSGQTTLKTTLAQNVYAPKLSRIRQCAKDVACVPKTIPGKGQGYPRCRALVELLLKT
jgi:hypothetical protein